jgi:regulatory protein
MLHSVVRSTPRKLASEDLLYAAAMRALMRRAYSVYEMRVYLERRAEDKSFVQRVLHRLKDHDYIDDARYARQFARTHAQNRRQGSYRIARDLRARGIPDRHIEAALAEAFVEADEASLVRQRIERKLKNLRGPLDQRRLASIYGGLLRAGFSFDVIRRELRALTKLAAELPDPPPLEEC